MSEQLAGAGRVMLYRFECYAKTIAASERESFFDARNADLWVPAFAEWLIAEQRKSAEVRASNE